ncbi:hypothetical protein GGR58DRAFT_84563 [Xylaria digitata]|nr:hypothetical protein GGR58DRAFT_84563 [Xylaria digitata]
MFHCNLTPRNAANILANILATFLVVSGILGTNRFIVPPFIEHGACLHKDIYYGLLNESRRQDFNLGINWNKSSFNSSFGFGNSSLNTSTKPKNTLLCWHLILPLLPVVAPVLRPQPTLPLPPLNDILKVLPLSLPDHPRNTILIHCPTQTSLAAHLNDPKFESLSSSKSPITNSVDGVVAGGDSQHWKPLQNA